MGWISMNSDILETGDFRFGIYFIDEQRRDANPRSSRLRFACIWRLHRLETATTGNPEAQPSLRAVEKGRPTFLDFPFCNLAEMARIPHRGQA